MPLLKNFNNFFILKDGISRSICSTNAKLLSNTLKQSILFDMYYASYSAVALTVKSLGME